MPLERSVGHTRHSTRRDWLSTTKRDLPSTRDLASYWLRGAYQRAKIARPDGSLWHVFRRGCATDRKHLLPKDVAAAGGWRDISTLINCYQQPDEATIKAVVEYRKPGPRCQRGPECRAFQHT